MRDPQDSTSTMDVSPRKQSYHLETFAVVLWMTLLPITFAVFLFLCSFKALWPAIAAYLIYICYIDESHYDGSCTSHFMRSLGVWRWFVGYFPIILRKTVELDPEQKYIFGYHPHGVISMGAMANFATEATCFSRVFPGIKPHLLTLDSNFKIPLYRDVILSLGICGVSMKSCRSLLNNSEKGTAIVIVVGGASESLSAHPGTMDLTIKKRYGFVKLAFITGASLVPVLSFGENDIFEQLPNEQGSKLYQLQTRLERTVGFTLPLFFGRGVFDYNNLGLMPFRRPITTVVGEPITVVKKRNPTYQEIEDVKAQYTDQLQCLWDTYKDIYAPNRTREMSFK